MSKKDEDKKKEDELNKRYDIYEICYITFLSICVIVAWILSSDIVTEMISSRMGMNRLYSLLATLIISVILAAIFMRIVRKILWKIIHKLFDHEKRKNEEA